jgi:hypothetical protein
MNYPLKITSDTGAIPGGPYVFEIITALWEAERGMDNLVLKCRGEESLVREAKAIQTAFKQRRRALEDLTSKK